MLIVKMKADIYENKDTREGLKQMLIDWWNRKEMGLEDRMRYYLLKSDLCRTRLECYEILKRDSDSEREDYVEEFMNR